MKPYTRPNDVNNGIDRTDFVEMNFLNWRVMDVRLGLSKFLKNARSTFSNGRSELRIRQNFKNGGERTVLLLVFGLDAHIRGGHAIFPDLLAGQRPTWNLQGF